MRNLSYENEFDLHLNEILSKTDFHMKGFALELGLKQRQRELGNGLLHEKREERIIERFLLQDYVMTCPAHIFYYSPLTPTLALLYSVILFEYLSLVK